MSVRTWLTPESAPRRRLVALAVYLVCGLGFALAARPELLREHTVANHFALLADAWLHGRQNLTYSGPFGGPEYAQGNDFAQFEGKTYISFPPFPALLMVPFVKLAGSPEAFQDGQFVLWLAGVGPAFLFLALEKLRRTGRTTRSERENVALALLLPFGTVYFFTAVQGTVWFAGHVVGLGLLSAFILCALDAEKPWAAGLLLSAIVMTRPSIAPAGLLFFLEAFRVSSVGETGADDRWLNTLRQGLSRLRAGEFAKRLAALLVPLIATLLIASWMNYARFRNPSPTAFGHEHLTVVWHERMVRWGLFHYHYVAHNLGILLTSLPWWTKSLKGSVPFQISEHGLALWFTTPLYLWILWPKRKGWLYTSVVLAALGPVLLDLAYQNSGWRQFGYRFSNDYAPLLFVLLALGGRPFGPLFKFAATWAIAWNLFGALTFDRSHAFYQRDPGRFYQPD